LRCSYCCHVVEHRAGTNRSFKNFIRISALEVLAASFDFIGPPLRIALESFLIAGWQMMGPVSHVNWLIWSSDHGGWSKPNRHGYTNRLADAGRYSFDEALEIVQDANAGTFARNFPSETMCPDWTEEAPGAKH
jgi:hypothetical protein